MAPMRLLKDLSRVLRQGQEVAAGATATASSAPTPKAPLGFTYTKSGLLVPEEIQKAVYSKTMVGKCEKAIDAVMDTFDVAILRRLERFGMLCFRTSLTVGGIVASGAALHYSLKEASSGAPFKRYLDPEGVPIQNPAQHNSLCNACSGQGATLNFLQVKIIADAVYEMSMDRFAAGIDDALKEGKSIQFALEICQFHKEILETSVLTPSQVEDVQKLFLDAIVVKLNYFWKRGSKASSDKA